MCKTSVSREKQIEYIMAHFDFEKVQRVMEFLHWKWGSGWSSRHAVPTVQEIRKSALEKLNSIGENKSLRGGGLCVHNHSGTLTLSFEIEWQWGTLAKYYKGDLTP